MSDYQFKKRWKEAITSLIRLYRRRDDDDPEPNGSRPEGPEGPDRPPGGSSIGGSGPRSSKPDRAPDGTACNGTHSSPSSSGRRQVFLFNAIGQPRLSERFGGSFNGTSSMRDQSGDPEPSLLELLAAIYKLNPNPADWEFLASLDDVFGDVPDDVVGDCTLDSTGKEGAEQSDGNLFADFRSTDLPLFEAASTESTADADLHSGQVANDLILMVAPNWCEPSSQSDLPESIGIRGYRSGNRVVVTVEGLDDFLAVRYQVVPIPDAAEIAVPSATSWSTSPTYVLHLAIATTNGVRVDRFCLFLAEQKGDQCVALIEAPIVFGL